MSEDDYRLLSAEEITNYLGILLDRLAARNVAVDTYLIGGVALAIHLGREQLTPDVDGYFKPKTEVFAEAAAMAEEFDLDPEWVNERAAAFIAFDPADDQDALVTEVRGHRVTVASKRVLLAMKIAASRAKDRADINALILDLDIRDADELVELAFAVFGEQSMTLPESRDEVRLLAGEALRRARPGVSPSASEPHGAQLRRAAGSAGGRGGEFLPSRNSPPEIAL